MADSSYASSTAGRADAFSQKEELGMSDANIFADKVRTILAEANGR
jgi:hypothetical protein